MAVKIDAIWPHHQYGWHAFQYLTVVRRIPDALLSIRCRRSGGYRDWADRLPSRLGNKGGSIAQNAGFGSTGRAKVRVDDTSV